MRHNIFADCKGQEFRSKPCDIVGLFDNKTRLVVFIQYMFARYLASLFIFMLSMTAYGETSLGQSVELGLSALEQSSAQSDNPDCEEHDCPPGAECCASLCSCPPFLFYKGDLSGLQIVSAGPNRPLWHYYHKYNSPPLYPALKPPLFG